MKFANSKWLEKSDFKKIGLKSKKNMFGRMQYFRNSIRNGKDTDVLNDILGELNQIYDINYNETTADLTIQQKLAQKISSNRFLRKIPFIEKYVKKQLYILPDTTQKQIVNSTSDKRKSFIEELSNGSKYMKIYERKPIKLGERKNTEIGKDINKDEKSI